MKTLLLLLLSSLAHCSAPAAPVSAPVLQDAPPAPAPPPALPPAAAAPSPEEARARQLLERAARFQRGDQPLSPPLGLHAAFHVTVSDSEQGGKATVRVERWYARGPERMVTHRVDDVVESNSTVGYNDGIAWFVDHASGRVVFYSDDPETFAVDLDQLDEQLRLMPLLLDAAVLDALIPRLRDPRVAGEDQVRDLRRQTHDVVLVEATMDDELFGPDPDQPPSDEPVTPQLAVRLGIEEETGAVWSFGVRTLQRSPPRAIELVFGLHLPTGQGLRLPANITVYEDGRRGDDWSAQLGVRALPDEAGGEDRILFEIDPPLPPGLFDPPPRT